MSTPKLQEGDTTFSHEEAIAFTHFRTTEENDLFEGEEYIWRRIQINEAMAMMPFDLQPQLRAATDDETLQNIAGYSKDQFRFLEGFGIRAESHFIVHEVNGKVCLVIAVPHISNKSPLNEVGLAAWKRYLSEFENMQQGLLEYFDYCHTRQAPILYDLTRRWQWVYGVHGDQNEPVFHLVDTEPRFDDRDSHGRQNFDTYEQFLRHGEDIAAYIEQDAKQAPESLRPSVEESTKRIRSAWRVRRAKVGVTD